MCGKAHRFNLVRIYLEGEIINFNACSHANRSNRLDMRLFTASGRSCSTYCLSGGSSSLQAFMNSGIRFKILVQAFGSSFWFKFLVQAFSSNIQFKHSVQPFQFNHLAQAFSQSIRPKQPVQAFEQSAQAFLAFDQFGSSASIKRKGECLASTSGRVFGFRENLIFEIFFAKFGHSGATQFSLLPCILWLQEESLRKCAKKMWEKREM